MSRKILYLGDAVGFEGGIERYAHQTAAALREQGFEVWFAGEKSGRNETEFRAGFDRVVSLSEAAAHAAEFALAMLHKPPPAETLDELAAAFGAKLVFLAHDHESYCPRRHYYSPLGRKNCHRRWTSAGCALCSLPDALRARRLPGVAAFGDRLERLRRLPAVVVSEFMRGRLLANGFRPETCYLIPPFIDPPAILPRLPAGDGRIRLLFLGQLIRGKGTDLLIQVLARLKTPFRAVIAGDGKDRGMMEQMAVRLGVREQLEFAGWQSQPERLFAAADLVVLPFRWQEPFGLVGLEAAAHGVPIVAFNLGGAGEWLRDGWNGVMVEPHRLDAMAAAVDTLAGQPELRNTMGQNGVKLATEHFSRKRYLENMEKLIGSLS